MELGGLLFRTDEDEEKEMEESGAGSGHEDDRLGLSHESIPRKSSLKSRRGQRPG